MVGSTLNHDVTPSQTLIMPRMGLNIEKPPQLILPAGEAANNVTPAVEGNANGIIPIPPNTTPKTGLGQPPRGGGGRGGRSRGGRGGGGGVGPVMFPFKGIIITEQSFQ